MANMTLAAAAGDSDDEQKKQLIENMTQGDFAKLYRLKDSQCLVTWNETNEGTYFITMQFRVYGVRSQARFDFEDLESCLTFWNGISREGAAQAYQNVKEEFLTIKNSSFTF